MAERVRFYFDFISPYSYLASQRIEQRADLGELSFDYRPVVFGTILSRLEKKGPGEIPAQRKRGLEDVLLLANQYGIDVEGPPTHPFNSIYALRSVVAVEDADTRRALAHAYFRKAWAEGESLEDLEVLSECLAAVGVSHDPEEVATTRAHRQALKRNTKELLELGGWGVPTFAIDDQLFFGHDRLDLLLAYVRGDVRPSPDKVEELLARPQPGRIV